jgi:hypothetical protein
MPFVVDMCYTLHPLLAAAALLLCFPTIVFRCVAGGLTDEQQWLPVLPKPLLLQLRHPVTSEHIVDALLK